MLPRYLGKLKIEYLVGLILLFAAAVRLNGVDFGLPYIYNSDENYFIRPAFEMLATGDFNPRWFGHPGSFIMYLFLAIFSIFFIIAYLMGVVSGTGEFYDLFVNQPTLFFISGRAIMVLFSVTSVYLTYLIGRKMFNRSIGVLAAFCLTISPLHVEHSRLIRTDITATMLILFSFYFLLGDIGKRDRGNSLMFSALFAGFAIATKYTSCIIMVPIMVHCLLWDIGAGKTAKRMLIDLFQVKLLSARALWTAFVGFTLFAPYAILDYGRAIYGATYEMQNEILGCERLPGLGNFNWYLSTVLRDGIGGTFFIVLAGLGAVILMFRQRAYSSRLLLLFVCSFFFVVGGANQRIARWLIPVLPFEALLFGSGLYFLFDYLMKNKVWRKRRSGPSAKAAIAVLLGTSLVLASKPAVWMDVSKGTLLRQTDTRTLAKNWVEATIPQGTRIAYERYTPHFRTRPKRAFILTDLSLHGIGSKPFAWYEEQGVEYIIISNGLRDMFLHDPVKFSQTLSRYGELADRAELVKVFDNAANPGPVVSIYRLMDSGSEHN